MPCQTLREFLKILRGPGPRHKSAHTENVTRSLVFSWQLKWQTRSKETGGVLLYISYIGMCRHIGYSFWRFAPFWSENGYRLCSFWSGIGYGLRRKYELIYRFNSRWIWKKEKCASPKWILRNLFWWRSNLLVLMT